MEIPEISRYYKTKGLTLIGSTFSVPVPSQGWVRCPKTNFLLLIHIAVSSKLFSCSLIIHNDLEGVSFVFPRCGNYVEQIG